MTIAEMQRAIRKNRRLISLGLEDLAPGVPGGTHIPEVTSGIADPHPLTGAEGDIYYQVDIDGVIIKAFQRISGVWTELGEVNPAWISMTPTVTAGTGTITSFTNRTAKYRVIGKVCFFQASVWVNAQGTGAGTLKVELPFEPTTLSACASAFAAIGGGVGACGFAVSSAVSGLGYPSLWILKYDGTTVIASGKETIMSITYEIV